MALPKVSPNKKAADESRKLGGYYSFDGKTKESILSNYGKTIDRFSGDVNRRVVKGSSSSTEVVDDVFVRVPFTRQDYEYFRPNEALPSKFPDIVTVCRNMYTTCGIVRNVIDLMTDFACEDITLVHPDKKVEAFFRVWMQKCNLRDAAEEFARHFFIDSNVVVKRITAKIGEPVRKQWLKTMASPDIKLYVEKDNLSEGEIPIRYMFLNVAALEWQSSEIGKLTGEKELVFKLSPQITKALRASKDPKALDKLPADFREAILKRNLNHIELNPDKLYICHGKKDSWENWSLPFLMAIIRDIFFKDKLRQAEIAALDGVINVVRLWKLGDHKEGILPTSDAVDKLINILQSNPGGGAMDIVWDSMIDMQDYYPPIDKILGAEKYTQVNRDILIGLGIPEVLIGGAGANFSNSWIQLKTVVEKLEAVRSKLSDWIMQEVAIVARAIGATSLPLVRFNQMNLQDENVTKKLIVDLLDRGIVSIEAVLTTYGEDFLLEVERIKREKKDLKDAGIKVLSPLEKAPAAKPSAGVGSGRPPTRKDVTKRKEKVVKPRTGAMLFAMSAIDAIDEHVVPLYMDSIGASNARKLTAEQRDEITRIKHIVLSKIEPDSPLDKDSLIALSTDESFDKAVIDEINRLVAEYAGQVGQQPTLSQRKTIEAMAWVNTKVEITET